MPVERRDTFRVRPATREPIRVELVGSGMLEVGEVVADAKPQVLGAGDVGPDRDGAHDRSLLAVTDAHDHRAAVVVGARVVTFFDGLDRDDEPVSGAHGYRSMRTAT